MSQDRAIPYRGATYSAGDTAFMAWWRDTMPDANFGDARAAYDEAQGQKARDAAKRERNGWSG
jgi:hypothetical protein